MKQLILMISALILGMLMNTAFAQCQVKITNQSNAFLYFNEVQIGPHSEATVGYICNKLPIFYTRLSSDKVRPYKLKNLPSGKQTLQVVFPQDFMRSPEANGVKLRKNDKLAWLLIYQSRRKHG